MNTAGYIDVHHHILPPFYRDALLSAGLSEVDGAPLPDWTAPDMVSMMDDRGIEVALVSLPPPGVAFGDRRATVKLTRRCNEFAAELVAGRPRRLGAFGSLPLPDVDAALDEIRYLYDVLRLDGVALTSNVDGVYLGDPAFEPVFAELGRRDAVVFVHPVAPPVDPAPGLAQPAWFGEYVFDTTRAVANLALHGTLWRHRSVRMIVAHAGGTAPFIANRLLNLWRETPGAPERAPEEPLELLRRLYYDTASCGLGHGLRLVRELVGADRVLLGSDHPFVPAHSTTSLAKRMADPAFLGVPMRTLRDNALRLFPRFAPTGGSALEPGSIQH